MRKILAIVFGGILVVSAGLLIVFNCRGGNQIIDDSLNTGEDLSSYFDPELSEGVIEFSHDIMDFEHFDRIIPLGQINPPGHTFPTDHIYLVLNGLGRPVYAPTGGKILHIDEPSVYGDCAIRIGVTNTMAYYLGHIFIGEGLQVGDTVLAGAQIGTSGNTSCIDFGVINKNVNNTFLSQKHPVTTLYGDKPLSYFNEPLRTQLYALVKPAQSAEDPDYVYNEGVTDGEFVIDQAGTLMGNWFKEGCFNSEGWHEWEDTLATLLQLKMRTLPLDRKT